MPHSLIVLVGLFAAGGPLIYVGVRETVGKRPFIPRRRWSTIAWIRLTYLLIIQLLGTALLVAGACVYHQGG